MRSFVIDFFKAVAAQLIVLHHLSFYGPISAVVERAVPLFSHFLMDYARMAVQAFIVIGGWLAARGFANAEKVELAPSLFKRYLRLVLPFLAALVLTTLIATFIRPWFSDEMMPDVPSVSQVLAHIFLVHTVLDYGSLSAGVWYVAIDFQLYLLFAVLCWGSRPRLHLPVVVVLTLLSLFHFNRNAGFDNWALYFFGAYGLGVIAFHVSRMARPLPWLSLLVAVTVTALWLDFRGRILVALFTAVTLVLLRDFSVAADNRFARQVAYLSRNSYALFLVHFSLVLLGNALFARMGWNSAAEALAMMALIWLAANLLADQFYKRVEQKTNSLSLPLPAFLQPAPRAK
ncbi:MAG TPA: acyltransferase family protein [Rhodocyclaceae bacterium]|jgi:peptidoglycan/LPS O-acetylase OafA/YrhL|nr:acyltransferase family protein [Rhodocyclaceae bacterium]